MIVTFEWPLKTLSGKDLQKGVVYQSCRDDTLCIMRRYVRPRITEHNHYTGAKFRGAILLYKAMNPEFLRDLKRYTDAFNNQLLPEKKLPLNQYNTFLKALLNKKVRLNDLDSFQGFADLFGNTIEAWIASGLLPKVRAKFAGVEAWVAVDSRQVTGDRWQVTGDRQQVAVDRVADVSEPAVVIQAPIVVAKPTKTATHKPLPSAENTARQAWRNRPKTQKTAMFMRDIFDDSAQCVIPMPEVKIAKKDDKLEQIELLLTKKADDG